MAKIFNQEIFALILVIFLLNFPALSFSEPTHISVQSKEYVCPYPCLPPPIPVMYSPPPPLPPGPRPPQPPPLPPPWPPWPPIITPPSPPWPPIITPPLPPGPPLPPIFPPWSAPPPPNPIWPYWPWFYKNPPPPPDYSNSPSMRVEAFSLVIATCMVLLALSFPFFL